VDLAPQRPVAAGDDVLHQLLGDGGATLHNPAIGGVRYGSPDDRFRVHAAVLVEALVLHRDHSRAKDLAIRSRGMSVRFSPA
jgi:hypothetical protein